MEYKSARDKTGSVSEEFPDPVNGVVKKASGPLKARGKLSSVEAGNSSYSKVKPAWQRTFTDWQAWPFGIQMQSLNSVGLQSQVHSNPSERHQVV